MNNKSKEARLCVSKEINRKKEKHLIKIMRSASMALIVILSMNCISSYDYKLDYKVPESKGEKLEPIEVKYVGANTLDAGRITFWGLFPWFIYDLFTYEVKIGYGLKNVPSNSFFRKNRNSEYYVEIDAKEVNTTMHLLTWFVIIPYYNSHTEKDIWLYIYKNNEMVSLKKIGRHSGWATGWLPLIPVQFFWSLIGDPNDSVKEKKLLEELSPIAYHILKEYIEKKQSIPANNNNPSSPTSGFTDTVVLKNGDFIENVKATVTIDSLIVTDANGKTTVYKKSQVLTVKKK